MSNKRRPTNISTRSKRLRPSTNQSSPGSPQPVQSPSAPSSARTRRAPSSTAPPHPEDNPTRSCDDAQSSPSTRRQTRSATLPTSSTAPADLRNPLSRDETGTSLDVDNSQREIRAIGRRQGRRTSFVVPKNSQKSNQQRVQARKQVRRDSPSPSRTSPRNIEPRNIRKKQVRRESESPLTKSKIQNPQSSHRLSHLSDEQVSIPDNMIIEHELEISRRGSEAQVCAQCSRLTAQVNELKSRNSELAADKATMRRSAQLLEAESSRLRQQVTELEMHNEELSERNEQLLRQKGNRGKASTMKSMKKDKTVLSVNQQTIYERVLNNMKESIMEDYLEISTDENGYQLREWLLSDEESPRVRSVINFEEHGKPIIKTGSSTGALPVCPIELSCKGDAYTSRYSSTSNLLHDMLMDAIERDKKPLIKEKNMAGTIETLQRMLGPTFNLNKRTLHGDHRKAVRSKFLTVLGYEALGRTSSVPAEKEKREEERIVLARKLYKLDNGQLDITRWRLCKFNELRYSDAFEESPDFIPDKLFRNSAAKIAVDEMRGFKFAVGEGTSRYHEDATVMTLARTQAYVTGAMYLMRNHMKPGGNTGKAYMDQYYQLLPRSSENILATCRGVLKGVYPADLKFVPDVEEGRADVHVLVASRQGSRAFRMPHTKELYLAITSDFFKEHISGKLGRVLDCYVGVAKDSDSKFHRLKADRTPEDHDTSDDDIEGSNENDTESNSGLDDDEE